jgi:DNA invertase Pin-like site-specific DNA recombinase
MRYQFSLAWKTADIRGQPSFKKLYENPLEMVTAKLHQNMIKSALAKLYRHRGADMGKRAAIYLRVSTDEQTTENQERALREVAARSGHEIVAVYRDEGIGGSKGRDKRPGFDAMHKDASRRKFDIVMAWSVDRLGRSLQDLIGFLSELHSLGIDLSLHQQGIDTTTPAGKAMFQMMSVFAEFERSMIVERVRAGVARAKASGTKSGKAFGRPRTPVDLEKRIRDALATPGRPGFHKIAAQFGGATGTVQRIAAEA